MIESGDGPDPEPAKEFESSPRWVYVPVCVAFVLCFATIAKTVLGATRGTTGLAQEQLDVSQPPYCPIPELHDRPIVCFVNYVYRQEHFSHQNIPSHLCRHVVLCCLTDITKQERERAVAEGTALQTILPRTLLYLGFGGSHVNYTAVNLWFSNDSAVETLVDAIIRTALGLGFKGGAAVMLTDWMRIENRRMLANFTNRLRLKLEQKGDYSLVILMPPRPNAVVSYPMDLLSYGSTIPIALSHVTDVDTPHMGFLSCLTPNHFAGAMSYGYNVSLESMWQGLKELYDRSWPSLKKEIGYSFSLAWTYYVQNVVTKRTAGEPGILVGFVTYNNACTSALGRNRRTYRDYLTDCQVISDGLYSWFSGLGEESTQFLREHRDVRALGIFDIEFDDVNGVCRGFKFPQLQALHDVFRQS
ncbi:unnamed protein product [Ixodes hexagonus]